MTYCLKKCVLKATDPPTGVFSFGHPAVDEDLRVFGVIES